MFTSTLTLDTDQLVTEVESQAPKLAPNNQYALNVQLGVLKTSSTTTILRVCVKYEELNKSYDWEQKYRMQLETKTSGVGVYNYLSFIPIA